MDPRKIARHYLEFWFWIDVLACIPFEQILEGMYPNKASRKAIKMVKWFKIPRLLRLGRLLRYAKEYAKYWAPTALFFGVFFIMHLAACSWVGALDPCGEFIVLRESFVLEDGSVDVAPDWAWLFRDEGGKHGAENISGCVTCPDTHPFSYGDDDNGAHTTLAEFVS